MQIRWHEVDTHHFSGPLLQNCSVRLKTHFLVAGHIYMHNISSAMAKMFHLKCTVGNNWLIVLTFRMQISSKKNF